MLDIGWNELLIIALLTILVVGPKELPHVLRTVMQMVRKVRAMAGEFQSGIDDLAREAELDDLKSDIKKTASSDIVGDLEREIDPTGEVTSSMREIETSLEEDPRESAEPTSPQELTESHGESSPLTDDGNGNKKAGEGS